MTAASSRRRPPSQLRTLASPEAIALVLVAVVVLLLAAVAASLGGQDRPAATAPTGAPPSPRPSSTPVPASPGVGQAVIGRLVDANSQLAGLQVELETALADGAPASEVADLLRRSNTILSGARAAVELLAADPSAAALAGQLDAVYEGALRVNRQTLQAGLSNAAAYRSGAQGLLAMLGPLAQLDRSLRARAESPTP
ncbi:MAG: hypothetical protein AB1627_06930 [Chloroflexota bacterium]